MLKHFNTIEEMEGYISSKIHGSFSIMDMYILSDWVKKLEHDNKYLEIGVDYGKSAATAIFQAPQGVKFFFCDLIDREAPGEKFPQLLSRKSFFETENFNTIATFIQGDSKELASIWQRGMLDMIFIDGDHSFEGVKNDISGWKPHLKPGGFMLFHDYDITSPGVISAVNNYVRDSGEFTDFFVGMEKYNLRSSIVGAIKK